MFVSVLTILPIDKVHADLAMGHKLRAFIFKCVNEDSSTERCNYDTQVRVLCQRKLYKIETLSLVRMAPLGAVQLYVLRHIMTAPEVSVEEGKCFALFYGWFL